MKQTASVFAAWQQVSKDLFVKSGQIGLEPSCAAAVLTPLNNVLFAHDFIKLNEKNKRQILFSLGVQDFGNVFAHQPMRHFICAAPSQNALYLLFP